jgi:ABC-2 type transport system permease protein
MIIIALLVLPIFGVQWVYDNLIVDNLAILNSDQAVTAIATFLPLGLIALLVFAMLGVGDVMHQLYLTSDLELLMVAPIPSRAIYLVKFLGCSRATYIPALGIGASLMLLGIARGATVGYHLLVGSLILAAMMLTTALVMILVILLARFLPAQKVRSWMPAVIAMVMSLLLLGQGSATQWFLGQAEVITTLTSTLLNLGKLSQVVAALGGLALMGALVGYRIFDTSFHEGWNRLHEVPNQRAPGSGKTWRSGRGSRWAQVLPAPLSTFVVKEGLEFRRNPRGLISLVQPFLIVAMMVLIPVLTRGSGIAALQPLLFGFILMTLALMLGIFPVGPSLMSVAEEGRKISLLRSAPISMSEVLRGKFWASWAPLVFPWVLAILVSGLLLKFSLWQTGFLLGITTWGLTGASAATVAIGGLKVDFNAAELKGRIPILISYLIMGLNMVFVQMTIAIFVWLMVRLYPQSEIVTTIKVLSEYGVVGWIFSKKLWGPVLLIAGQVVFWIGVKALWNAAVRRLEAWEGI